MEAITTIRVQIGDGCWEFTRGEAELVCVELGRVMGMLPEGDGDENGEEIKLEG